MKTHLRALSGIILAAVVMLSLPGTAVDAGQLLAAQANCVTEVALVSETAYANPFVEITLDALVTGPDGRTLKVPAFWAGGNRWCFRYASDQVGRHTWRTECSDAENPKLHGVEGTIEVVPSTSENPLYRHGPVRVAANRRYFEHADGTPFFWLGDTWWKGLCKRLTWEGFQELTADREAKGYTVVQIIGGGPYPDEPLFDPRWANEGGMPYERDFVRVNPDYFNYADRRIEHMVDAGIVPALVGGWGWHQPGMVSNEAIDDGKGEWFYRHWRYLIARYGAYPVVWITAGEMRHPYLVKVAKYVRETDPFRRLLTMHPPGIPELQSGRKVLDNDAYCDFDLLQTAHNDWASAPITVSSFTASYSKTPIMPVVNSEVVYEWHKEAGRHDIQRFMFWTCMLNGAAGHTYGAGGLWQMNTPDVHGSDAYETTPWYVAMHFPGAAQIARGKKLLEEYEWWRFEPHPEWVEPHSSAHTEPHAEWYDNHRKWAEINGRADLPFAAGIPGEVRFIYIPGKDTYDLKAPVVRNLEPGLHYRAFLYEPIWGGRIDLGKVEKSHVAPEHVDLRSAAKPFEGHTQPLLFADSFDGTNNSAWKDHGTATKRSDGRLVGGKGMVTVLDQVNETNLMASVEANSDAEAGIILRYQDPDNYLLALYSPSSRSIYVHDRHDGKYGRHLGQVSVPEDIGPRIKLIAAATGSHAALVLTDGKNTCCTPIVKVDNEAVGKTGLWLYQVGERQEYDNFKLSRTLFGPSKAGRTPIQPSGPPTDYRPPQLPSPQDWVLVLENVTTQREGTP